MNLEPLRHFRIEFTNFAPVSGKPMTANLLFDNRKVAVFQSLDKKISYHHQNYNLHSTAYDYDGFLYQTLTELNDQVFAVAATERDANKMSNLYQYILTDNRFVIPVVITDATIGRAMNVVNSVLPALIHQAVKSYNTPNG